MTLVTIFLELLLEDWVKVMRFEIIHQCLVLILDVVMTNLQTVHFSLNPLVFLPQSSDLLLLRFDKLTTLLALLAGLDPCNLMSILIQLECEVVILVIGCTLS